ncbi:hypothetical protein FZEAL_717 [Fusarium zealandicum]|uniref:Uncharacterized protein n=1 Tax=Fusarium zealandicum TaxID=1053134 RepID=A0A8H4UU62_9HYPO|nr:hypothetical protein FZEAL_717 [Fusarium zealandicum]
MISEAVSTTGKTFTLCLSGCTPPVRAASPIRPDYTTARIVVGVTSSCVSPATVQQVPGAVLEMLWVYRIRSSRVDRHIIITETWIGQYGLRLEEPPNSISEYRDLNNNRAEQDKGRRGKEQSVPFVALPIAQSETRQQRSAGVGPRGWAIRSEIPGPS